MGWIFFKLYAFVCVERVVVGQLSVGIEMCEIPNFYFTSANSESVPGSSFQKFVSVYQSQLRFLQHDILSS